MEVAGRLILGVATLLVVSDVVELRDVELDCGGDCLNCHRFSLMHKRKLTVFIMLVDCRELLDDDDDETAAGQA